MLQTKDTKPFAYGEFRQVGVISIAAAGGI